MNSKQVAIYRQ